MKRYYFGRYIYKKSFLHNLNPLIKLVGLAFLIGAGALPSSPLRLGTVFLILIGLLSASKISIKEFYPSIRSFRFLIIFTILIQSFVTTDGHFILIPTPETLLNSAYVTLRFIFIIAFSAIYTITTTPADIAKSLYIFVKPFKIFKINTKDAAISILVAIRFIPLLFEESDKIVTAQKLRGIWKENPSLKEKFFFFIKAESFLIPLFMRVIYYAEQISITICYRNNLEAVMQIPKPSAKDILFLIISVALFWTVYAIR